MNASQKLHVRMEQLRSQRGCSQVRPPPTPPKMDNPMNEFATIAQNMVSSLMGIQSVKSMKERRKRVVDFFQSMSTMDPMVVRLIAASVGQQQFRSLLGQALGGNTELREKLLAVIHEEPTVHDTVPAPAPGAVEVPPNVPGVPSAAAAKKKKKRRNRKPKNTATPHLTAAEQMVYGDIPPPRPAVPTIGGLRDFVLSDPAAQK